ncbi:efflux RND transporter periplasmic adaptor subunit [Pseudodesulfovibrio methanolicus]|uniref:HlyD family efflux transporter periplasmic adaptor subunit n=1 Tax=Pseudodesulfovibrio methanolicus TaxID=3126690 RepID=A0ABZ2IUD6_9BACT
MTCKTSFAVIVFTAILLLACPFAHGQEMHGVDSATAAVATVFQGKVYCSMTYPVKLPYSGELLEKKTSVGQLVKKNDVLMKVRLKRKDALSLEARLDKKVEFTRQELDIKKWTARLKTLSEQLESSKALSKQGLAPGKGVAFLEDQISLIKFQIEQTRNELAQEKKRAADDRDLIAEMLGQKGARKLDTSLMYVRSPIAGYVIWENTGVELGAIVDDSVFAIGVMDPMTIRTQIYEADMYRLKIGDTAEVILEFNPEKVMKAKLVSMSWLPVDTNIGAPSYYAAELEIANPDNILKEGYKVRIMFMENEKTDVK